MSARILVVDDERAVRYTLEQVFGEAGYEVASAASAADALAQLDADADTIDALVTDLAMPGMDGIALCRAVRARLPELPVVLLTARGSERLAVEAMKAGAADYLQKPVDVDEICLVVERVLEAAALRRAHRRFVAERSLGRVIIGDAPAMRRVLAAAERLADRDVPVLVRGETGSGKELVAQLLHAASRRRANKPLVRVNCAAIPSELAESELFGHARGAFTGAEHARRGFFAEADGGTIVLDEVGELSAPLQAKLLRVIQQGEIQPLGTGRVEHVDVRVVSCTNRDLAADAKAGRFRDDLYYRLAVVELVVPPLRERREDIAALVEVFRQRSCDRFDIDVRFEPALVAALAARPWPGNVRELENTVARLVALAERELLGVADLERDAGADSAATAGGADGDDDAGDDATLPFRTRVARFERRVIDETLAQCAGNQSEAARRLGISRVTLIDKMKRYGLHPSRAL
ncbi:MAG: sigma-54-dependent Fis family transcriptional regulator [Myxococcales bacterium]|nr:sigma-54-dependent Fis family transcriptional regulator [Myxococcales bacterium]